jgi:acetyltransferase-like isoleucine patch superfamily enzyme
MVEAGDRSRLHFEDPLGMFPWALSKLYTMWLRSTYPFAAMGRHVSVHYTFNMSRVMAPRIKLGNSVSVGKDVWLNIIPEATDEVNIVIDDNCRISQRTWISAKNQIHLEPDVHLGPSVLIQDHGHAYDNPDLPIKKQIAMVGGRIRVERGCRIGQGVAIVCSKGELILGRNCVVEPNSVVVRSAPAYSVLGGNPARVVERFHSSDTNAQLSSSSLEEVAFRAPLLSHSPGAGQYHGEAE